MDCIPLISHFYPTYHLSNDFPWHVQHIRSFRLKVHRSLNPRCRKVAGSLRPLHFNITFGPRWRWQWPEISLKIWIKFKVDTIKGGLPANKYIYIYKYVCVLWWHYIMEKNRYDLFSKKYKNIIGQTANQVGDTARNLAWGYNGWTNSIAVGPKAYLQLQMCVPVRCAINNLNLLNTCWLFIIIHLHVQMIKWKVTILSRSWLPPWLWELSSLWLTRA